MAPNEYKKSNCLGGLPFIAVSVVPVKSTPCTKMTLKAYFTLPTGRMGELVCLQIRLGAFKEQMLKKVGREMESLSRTKQPSSCHVGIKTIPTTCSLKCTNLD